MKSLVKRSSAAAWLACCCAWPLVPAAHAVEILRWARLPLAVPLVVGQERVVFIERNVRIGCRPALASNCACRALVARSTCAPSAHPAHAVATAGRGDQAP